MAASPGNPTPLRLFSWLDGDRGLAGRLALSWAMAGGMSMEAILVVTAFLAGSPDSASVPFTATMFFAVGAAGGFLHGALVGLAGRPQEVTLGDSIRGLEAAAFWAVPGLLLCWVASLWISMTSMALALGRLSMILTVSLGWALTLVACGWGILESVDGFRHVMKRWPERRPGTVLVVLTFAVLLVSFIWLRPEIWFTDLRPSALGAFFLALGATVWIALPTLVVVLHFLHQWHADSAIWDGASTHQIERTG